MRGRTEAVWLAVLGLIGLLVAGTVVLGYWQTEQFFERARSLETAERRMEALSAVLSTMQEAETGQRGYLITGLDEYLEPFEAASRRLAGELETLDALYVHKPHLNSTLAEIRRLTASKMAELELTIDLRRSVGLLAAQARVLDHTGKVLMDQLKQWIASLRTAEHLGIARAEREYALQEERKEVVGLLMFVVVGLSTAGLMLFSLREMRASHRANEMLSHAATHDPLTGLANRRGLLTALEKALAESPETGDQPGLFFLDLDGFKAVNDRLGHEAGDQLLTSVASSLSTLCADSDFLARLGGDEFALVVRHLQSEDIALRIISRLKDRVASAGIFGRDFPISASVGFARFPDHATSVSGLLSFADHRMYADKAASRERHHVPSTRGCLSAPPREGLSVVSA